MGTLLRAGKEREDCCDWVNPVVENREHDAYLQAGHAVGAWLEGIRVVALSITPDGEVSSWIEVDEPEVSMARQLCLPSDRESAQSIVRALLTGPAAVDRYGFGRCSDELLEYGKICVPGRAAGVH